MGFQGYDFHLPTSRFEILREFDDIFVLDRSATSASTPASAATPAAAATITQMVSISHYE